MPFETKREIFGAQPQADLTNSIVDTLQEHGINMREAWYTVGNGYGEIDVRYQNDEPAFRILLKSVDAKVGRDYQPTGAIRVEVQFHNLPSRYKGEHSNNFTITSAKGLAEMEHSMVECIQSQLGPRVRQYFERQYEKARRPSTHRTR